MFKSADSKGLLCLKLKFPKVYYVLNCSFQQCIMFKTDVSNSLQAINLANTIIQNIEKCNVKLILAHKTELKQTRLKKESQYNRHIFL